MYQFLTTISALSLPSSAMMGSSRIAAASPGHLFATTLFLLYILPVAFLAMGVIPFKWRFQTLLVISLVALILSWRHQYSPVALGFSVPRVFPLVLWSIVPMAVLLIFVLMLNLRDRRASVISVGFFIFFVFVSAPAQEFVYRSFLFAQMDALTHWPNITKIVVSAALYSVMHVIYWDGLTVLLTFTVGLLWAALYLHTRSFAIVAISHALLGAVAIFLGVI